MRTEEQSLELLSGQVGDIIMGTAFLLFGLAAAGIALIRRRSEVRILIWLAIWSGMYGARLLILSPAVITLFPQSLQIFRPYVTVSINYLIVVFALLAWLELIRDKLRLFLQTMIFVGLAIGLAGIGWFIIAGSTNILMLYNNLLAACTLLVLITVVIVKKLSDRFLVLPNRGILAVGTLVFALEALYTNFSNIFRYRTLPILDSLGFAVLLFSLAFVAAQTIFANERRLFSIEKELETARQIQSSILPAHVPELNNLSVAAAYHPMTAVAGDFYDYIWINQRQAGFLVADVSGHGVPAALIAAMMKVAMQSVVASAHDPGEVLRRLCHILGNQLRGQFVSAAYLYIDSETSQARYSAAGHPPLLHWDSAAREVRLVESNGLLFGVLKETDYPVCELAYKRGDRFILYTDGLTEAENSAGEIFGDHRFIEVIRSHENAPAGELSTHILNELRLWRHARMSQQDDITWIIIDIM
jgi:sigma-B regulation protein RsbU (phosphoserine phosphatase)